MNEEERKKFEEIKSGNADFQAGCMCYNCKQKRFLIALIEKLEQETLRQAQDIRQLREMVLKICKKQNPQNKPKWARSE